jgi:hypothetical protein
MYACQNYTSASGGIPKTIRGNTTILCVFKNKNMKELDIIAEECSGEVDVDTFMAVHEAATEGDYSFLTIDLNRKSTHPSMFRKCWNEWITAQVVPSLRQATNASDLAPHPNARTLLRSLLVAGLIQATNNWPRPVGQSKNVRVRRCNVGCSEKIPYRKVGRF